MYNTSRAILGLLRHTTQPYFHFNIFSKYKERLHCWLLMKKQVRTDRQMHLCFSTKSLYRHFFFYFLDENYVIYELRIRKPQKKVRI